MIKPLRLCLLLVLSMLAALVPGAALAADPGHRPENPNEELFEGEGAVSESQQHVTQEGHLPPKHENVRLLGKVEVHDPTGEAGIEERVADVAAWGNYAYLTGFRNPSCEGGGFYVIDISDPFNPVEIVDAWRPAAPGNYAGEGAHVIDVETPTFTGQILVHNNEICDFTVEPNASGGGAGISLWDVTDPTNPQPLRENFGDTTTIPGDETNPDFTFTHEYHSAFAWEQEGRVFVVGTDNDESEDIDIFDITDPRNPVLVAETGLDDFPEAMQDPPPHGDSPGLHDMVVENVGGQWLMLASYWDAGYIILDMNDPENPTFLRATTYADTEPFAEEMGLPEGFRPEGNAHQAEFSPDGSLFVATDEDFNPYRIVAEITTGPYAGTEFSATQGSDTPPIGPDMSVQGPTEFVGEACDALPDAPSTDHVALIERGTCAFTVKAQNAQAAGYAAGIVFNSANETCESLVNMLVEADIPMLFVDRPTGFNFLGMDPEDPCNTAAPAPGSPSADVSIEAVFDGWGYVHLYNSTTMEDIDQYAIPESLDPAFAEGFGDLSVHEVAVDKNRPGRAYLSYYSGGFRVIDYDAETGITEVGAFIDEGGNNFWGVEFHTLPDGRDVVLASDRDYGLYIFGTAGRTERLAGPNRLDTAVRVSMDTFGDGEADAVVLARADIYPDALAGTPLAVATNAPLLLTSSNRLDAVTADEIERVLPEGGTVHLLGGVNALEPVVQEALVDMGFQVNRIAGTTRIETSVEIAKAMGAPSPLLITTGYNFPDALAAGAAAGHVGGAVLLTTADAPHGAVDDYLADRDATPTYAIGGPAARAYPSMTAVSGPARYQTATAVAETFFDSPTVAGVSRDDKFPDALSGGAHIARLGGPMLLTPTTSLHSATAGYVCDQPIVTAYIYGGTSAISAETEAAVSGAVQGTGCDD